jgi:hypothetical protein
MDRTTLLLCMFAGGYFFMFVWLIALTVQMSTHDKRILCLKDSFMKLLDGWKEIHGGKS